MAALAIEDRQQALNDRRDAGDDRDPKRWTLKRRIISRTARKGRTMLRIDNLHATVADKPILNGLSLDVPAGEVHAIMGPNGAGKSTLAYVLGGRPGYEVTAGTATLRRAGPARPGTARARRRRAVPRLPVSGRDPRRVLPPVPARKPQCAAPRARRGRAVGRRVHPAGARRKPALLGMDMDMLKRPVNVGFSGGEKKRAEMVQMGIMDPRLAILDETDSGLDIDALKAVGAGINAIMRAPDKAVLLITHYQRLLDYVRPDLVHVLVGRADRALGRRRTRARARARRLCGGRRMTALPTRKLEAWRYADVAALRVGVERPRRAGADRNCCAAEGAASLAAERRSGAGSPRRVRARRGRRSEHLRAQHGSDIRPDRNRRDAWRRRTFRTRRGQHRRRQGDARDRHDGAPRRGRRDFAPGDPQCARRHRDRHLPRQGRGRA